MHTFHTVIISQIIVRYKYYSKGLSDCILTQNNNKKATQFRKICILVELVEPEIGFIN